MSLFKPQKVLNASPAGQGNIGSVRNKVVFGKLGLSQSQGTLEQAGRSKEEISHDIRKTNYQLGFNPP
jgi:hypothetical protein